MTNKQQVNLDQFSPQQLYQLKQGFQGELNSLSQSLNQFRFAMEKYEEGKRAIKAAEQCKPNEELMIPLSNSLYIEGVLSNIQNNQRLYLIEYGAGFFVESKAQVAIDFYQRKITMIRQKVSKLQELINQKREGARACEMKINALMQQQQAQLQQQQQKA